MKDVINFPYEISHNLTDPSFDPDANNLELGETANVLIYIAWPLN